MSKVTVSQLADVLGVEGEKLLEQLNDAGIVASGADDAVSNDDKKKLLAYLRASHGKVESDATAPRKVTLKRKTVSELRVSGSGPRAATRTVNVEVRKRRTYVKREVVQEQMGTPDAEREEARKLLEESRSKRAAEDQVLQDAADKVRQEKEKAEATSLAAEEQVLQEMRDSPLLRPLESRTVLHPDTEREGGNPDHPLGDDTSPVGQLAALDHSG